MDCSSSGSFIHGIIQTRIVEWVAIPCSRGSSWPRDWTWVSCIVGRFFTVCATSEVQYSYSVQFSWVTQSCPTLCDPMNHSTQASLSITNSWSSPRLTSIESVMPSSHLIFYCPLLLLPPIPPSIRIFSKESALRMKWTKYWNFSLSISLPNEHPELVSFRMDWLDLLAVQGTLKNLLQHHSSKYSY